MLQNPWPAKECAGLSSNGWVFSGSPLRGEGRAKGKFETVQLHYHRRAPDNAAPVKALMRHFCARVKSLRAPLHDQRRGCRGLGLDFYFFFPTFLQFRVCVTTLPLAPSRSECVSARRCVPKLGEWKRSALRERECGGNKTILPTMSAAEGKVHV